MSPTNRRLEVIYYLTMILSSLAGHHVIIYNFIDFTDPSTLLQVKKLTDVKDFNLLQRWKADKRKSGNRGQCLEITSSLQFQPELRIYYLCVKQGWQPGEDEVSMDPFAHSLSSSLPLSDTSGLVWITLTTKPPRMFLTAKCKMYKSQITANIVFERIPALI